MVTVNAVYPNRLGFVFVRITNRFLTHIKPISLGKQWRFSSLQHVNYDQKQVEPVQYYLYSDTCKHC